MQDRCVHIHVCRENSLFQNLLPLGGREGLELQAGLVDEYDRQVEVRVPHLELTKNIYIYISTGSMVFKKKSSFGLGFLEIWKYNER